MKRLMGMAALLVVAAGCGPRLAKVELGDPQQLLALARAGNDDKAHAVVLSHEQRYLLMVWKSDKDEMYEQLHRAVLVLTERGAERYAEVRVPVPRGGELVHLEARTLSPDGEVREVKPEEVFEDEHRFRDGDRDEDWDIDVRTFRFPRVRPGSIVEYAYTARKEGLQHVIVERPAGPDPIKRYELELRVSRYLRYDIDLYNVPAKIETSTEGGLKKIRLVLRDIPAIDDDDLAPDSTWTHPWVVYRNKQYAFRRSVYNLTRTWPDAMSWLAFERYLEEDHHFADFTLKLSRDGCETPRCLAAQALDVARERAELSGFAWRVWQTRALAKVISRGKANNHEKALLVYKLLNDAGVSARFAYTVRRHTELFDDRVPFAGAFNHTLLYLPKQPGLEEPLWLDPSCELCGPGAVPPWSEGARALVVTGEKTRHEPKMSGELLVVDAPVLGFRKERRRHDATLSEDGTLEVETRIEGEGAEAIWWRKNTRTWSDDDHRRAAESDVRDRMRTGVLLDFEPRRCDRRLGKCARSTRFRLPFYATRDGDALLLPLTLFRHPWDNWLWKKTRDVDVVIGEPWEGRFELRVKLPPGYRPTALPAEELRSQAFDFQLESRLEGDTLVVARSLRLKPGRFAKQDYAALRRPIRAFSKVRQRVVVLEKVSDALADTAPWEAP